MRLVRPVPIQRITNTCHSPKRPPFCEKLVCDDLLNHVTTVKIVCPAEYADTF